MKGCTSVSLLHMLFTVPFKLNMVASFCIGISLKIVNSLWSPHCKAHLVEWSSLIVFKQVSWTLPHLPLVRLTNNPAPNSHHCFSSYNAVFLMCHSCVSKNWATLTLLTWVFYVCGFKWHFTIGNPPKNMYLSPGMQFLLGDPPWSMIGLVLG